MTKIFLRELYKEKRSAMTELDRLRADDLLLIQFQHLAISNEVSVLLSYWPIQRHAEPNTHLMTDYLQFRMPGLQIAYPVTDFAENSMHILLVDDTTDFKINEYGIAEPVSGMQVEPIAIDMVFVPLLVFDTKGNRVGYGKGFYDRFLPACRKDVIKIGFSFFEPVEAIDGISQFDVPLTIGITPNAIYEF
jgi:5-formyltetrahydrofolate cyclo-ligase